MPIVIAQKRNSEYNNKIGIKYHYPYRYWSLISEGVQFVYYHPKEDSDSDSYYFGHGRIGAITRDTTSVDNRYAEIVKYTQFSKRVPHKIGATYVEDGIANVTRKQPPFQKSVRLIDQHAFDLILSLADLDV